MRGLCPSQWSEKARNYSRKRMRLLNPESDDESPEFERMTDETSRSREKDDELKTDDVERRSNLRRDL